MLYLTHKLIITYIKLILSRGGVMKTRLFNKDFTLLWLGQSVSQMGNGAGMIAVLWWVQTTTGSAMALGTLAMVQTLMGTAISPFAGALADRVNRKWVIVGADVIRGLIYCLLSWLAFSGQLTLPVLFLTMGTAAVCSQFFYPAISSSIPLLVPDKDLERANSLNQMSVNMVNVLGYAAGGILVALAGVPALLLINGISFILSAFSETFIVIPRVVREGAVAGARAFLTDIKEGFIYVRSNKVIFKIMQVAMILNFFFTPYFILLPKFVNEYMGAGSDVYGFLLSAQMAGALVATLVISLTDIIKRNLWLIKWSIMVQATLLLSLPFLPVNIWPLHVSLFAVLGLFNASLNIYFGALVQRATDRQHMGKVFGIMGAMSQGLQPLSQGITGMLGEIIRLPVIFTVCSIANGLGGLMFARVPGLDYFLAGNGQRPAPEKEPEPVPVSA